MCSESGESPDYQKLESDFSKTDNREDKDSQKNQMQKMRMLFQIRQNQSEIELKQAREARDRSQADQLIQKQMFIDQKQQYLDIVEEYESKIEDLRYKLDKTEYIIQYKEKIWTYLEREIRKVVAADSDLMLKIQKETKIITECLAETKVSNVVKQNTSLLKDHKEGCQRLAQINKDLKKVLL